MALVGKDYVFIHIYKTGGNSLRDILPKGKEVGSPHACFKQVFQLCELQSKEVIVTVRDPYSWNCSLYNYIKISKGHPLHELCNRLSFEDWLLHLGEKLLPERMELTKDSYLTQTQFIEGVDHDNLFVIRQEQFTQDVRGLFDNMGWAAKGVPVKNKRGNKHTYDKWLTENAIQLINKYFQEDFKTFGYEQI